MTRKTRAPINDYLMGDDAMTHFMIDIFGRGNFTFDPATDVWVAVDPDHVGEGRGFVIVERGGSWFHAVIPPEVLQ
jgi:hypothetical protein